MITLRPQDVFVLLAIARPAELPFNSFGELAGRTGISPGEVHKSLRRASAAGLYHAESRLVAAEPLREFLVHGVRYAFPAVRGAVARGVPTGIAASPLDAAFGGASLPAELAPVWPDPMGTRRGYSIEPLYRTVPAAASRDPWLYELLALTDALRDGRARERSAAQDALSARLFL